VHPNEQFSVSTGPVSDSHKNKIDELKQEQGRLEELLFLVNPERRGRVHRMLAFLRGQIANLQDALTPAREDPPTAQVEPRKSLDELRREQSDLEETLFIEPPERRGRIKQLLAQKRSEIRDAEAAEAKARDKKGPSQVA